MRFVLALFSCSLAFATPPSPAITKLLGTAPIRFEPNSGLQPAAVRWSARGQGYSFAFASRANVLNVGNRSVRLTFPGANKNASFGGLDRQAVPTNYFFETKRLSVPAYSRLRETGVYRGIDIVYYGNGREIEYDFEIAAGADPSKIRMRFDGVDAVRLDDRGDVLLTLGKGEITQRAPVVYQKRASGEVTAVDARYRIAADGTIRVDLGAYDRNQKLIIDPAIAYNAYLAGTGADAGIAVAHDAAGVIYLAGNTNSMDFPAGGNGSQSTNAGGQDVWLMKIDPTQGSNAIVYSSFLGGGADETLNAMAIDKNGVFYLAGLTNSGAFPVSSGALLTTLTGNHHGWVSMIDPAQGSSGLVYSTYLGGKVTDEADGIAVANGKIYVTGTTDSDDFPIAGTAPQATRSVGFDAFVVELDPAQSGAASEVFGTFLGGQGADQGRSIAVDSAGQVYVAGTTFSYDFPVTMSGYQQANLGSGDSFVSVLDPVKGTIVYSTFLGGSSEDEIMKITLDSAGRVAMMGYTLSFDFPVTPNAYQTILKGIVNVFLATLDLSKPGLGNGLAYSSFFGGTLGEVGYDMKLDAAGRFYVGGYTFSPDFPVTPNALNPTSLSGAVDGFISVIDPAAKAGNGLVYSSYVTSDGYQIVYGIDVDSTGLIYVTGLTTANVFPAGLVQNPGPGKYSVFVFTLALQ